MVDYIIPIEYVKPMELQILNNSNDSHSLKEKIAIIGTGNYGIALGRCLMKCGFEIIYGSRDPNPTYLAQCFNEKEYEDLKNYSVTTIDDALLKSDEIVFLAVSATESVYESLVSETKKLKKTKPLILVEISNQLESIKSNMSNAERLDKLVKENLTGARISIVKGFNLLSAYTIGMDRLDSKSSLTGGSQTMVPICGDDSHAKFKVSQLCNQIGFQTNDIGDLKQAINLEKVNSNSFADWYYPSIISFAFFVFNFIWVAINYYLFPKKLKSFEEYIRGFSVLSHLNKVLGFTSLQLLAWVYFGSVLASIFQLKNGTKYQLFPRCLDAFLRGRKQYGLWAFLYASLHTILTIYVMNEGYLKSWYNADSKLTLIGENNLITGALAYILFVLVALSSINSIANSLNWKEWQFVQTKIGITCLLVGLIHTSLMYLNIFLQRHTDTTIYTPMYLLTRVKLYGVYFPLLVLVLRFIFGYFPPLSRRIEAIRNGTYKNKPRAANQVISA